jgi:hypothetical protein
LYWSRGSPGCRYIKPRKAAINPRRYRVPSPTRTLHVLSSHTGKRRSASAAAGLGAVLCPRGVGDGTRAAAAPEDLGSRGTGGCRDRCPSRLHLRVRLIGSFPGVLSLLFRVVRRIRRNLCFCSSLWTCDFTSTANCLSTRPCSTL